MLAAFLFRSTLYWSMPVADGEPKGGGDVIEIFIFLLLLGFSLLGLFYAFLLAAIPKIRNFNYASKLAAAAFVTPVLFWFIHPHIPRLM